MAYRLFFKSLVNLRIINFDNNHCYLKRFWKI